MEGGWSISSDPAGDPTPGSVGFQLKALVEGTPRLDELPADLQREYRDWERRFPNLTIVGTKLPTAEPNEKDDLRLAVALRVVQLHLWPELKPLVETNGAPTTTAAETRPRKTNVEGERNERRSSSPCNLPRINP